MHAYVSKILYCDKDEMKDSKKFWGGIIGLEAIAGLVGIGLEGRCPGVICPGGQLS